MYIELGYGVADKMPVYPGLPEVNVYERESIKKGDDWNGTVFSMYAHAGTHADAPKHFVDTAHGISDIPIEKFVYNNPIMLDIPCSPKHLITVEDMMSAGGDELYEADIIFLNTGYWKLRKSDITEYQENFPALSVEAALFVRNDLKKAKAVAIDTLSIEDLKKGAANGYRVHKSLLDPELSEEDPVVIYEDYNPEPAVGKKLISAFVSPLRLKGAEATPVNIVVEAE